MRRPEVRLLLTCEHAGNRVPHEHRALFARAARRLASHRGWDAGALKVAQGLAAALPAPLVAATTTRLLVDLNRSPHNPAVFSELTRKLARDVRAELLAEHHTPHWARVRAALRAQRGTTIHVAVHSFTPRWQGATRRVAIGLLYDSRRTSEREFASLWQRELRQRAPGHAIRRNAPYRGGADGLTTALRRELPANRYVGLELELNQRLLATAGQRRRTLAALVESLEATLAGAGH